MGVMAAAIAVLVFLLIRGTSSKQSGGETQTARAPEGGPAGGGGFGPGSQSGGPATPPALRRNELGQPLNEDGRPIGPPDKLRQIRNQPLEPGEIPLVPPLFDDSAQREQFKKWWVDEFGRRVSVYESLEPREKGYPSAEQTEQLLEDYYDSAEPRRPGESVEDAYARRQAWRILWQRWLDDYGGTVQTISSRGGDPQHGEPTDPPVTPPGTLDPDPEPAPEAEGAPPGRGEGDPGGDKPIKEDGESR